MTGPALAKQPPPCLKLTLTTATVIAVLQGRRQAREPRDLPKAHSWYLARQSQDFNPDGSCAKAALNDNGDDGDEPVCLG